jgi:radical SAM protein with 4Fe4S-binding SPASM domain
VSLSNIDSNTSVLIMLNGNCCLPCYTFGNNDKGEAKLPLQDLRDILLWAANTEPYMPKLLFLTGTDGPLDSSVASVLKDMADQVITPLLPLDEQEKMGIPFSQSQTAIAPSLDHITANADNIMGRPVILHVERAEIGKIAEKLLLVQDSISAVTLRLRDIHLLDDCDIENYREQLAKVADIGLMKQASGIEGMFRLSNLTVLNRETTRLTRCPAGTGFVVIGPDAGIYPCPAFYYAGPERSMGSIHSVAKNSAIINRNGQQCGICGSEQCTGCPFLESSQFINKEQICKIYKAEIQAAEELMPRVAQSGYLFDCLRTLMTRDSANKSHTEGGANLEAKQQVNDITFNSFVKALHDIKLAAESVADKSSRMSYDSITSRWSDSEGIPADSRMGIFRKRVYEILTQLKQLQTLTLTANSGS